MLNIEKIGKNIAALRKQKGWSQAILSEKLNVSTQAVSKWETGNNLPDIDQLLKLSRLFGISINDLLLDSSSMFESSSLTDTMLSFYPQNERPFVEQLISEQHLKLSIDITATWNSKQHSSSLAISNVTRSQDISEKLKETIDASLLDTIPSLSRIDSTLCCPICGGEVYKRFSRGSIVYSCDSHCCIGSNDYIGEYVDGVLCFEAYEKRGEEWSSCIKNYNDYLRQEVDPEPDDSSKHSIEQYSQFLIQHLTQTKPKVILDIASGSGHSIRNFYQRIDWPCQLILTDLSYRILSWDKRYLEELYANPYLELIPISCDCSKLPIRDGSIDAVISYCGFESMCEDAPIGLQEAFRVLKPYGLMVYSMSLLGNIRSDNTQKWLKLIEKTGWVSKDEIENFWRDKDGWISLMANIGFNDTQVTIVKEENPVPPGTTFPFERRIMQWMAEALCISHKAESQISG